ncbi:right-handed parallel beta-helix repeat-containing protein [Dyella sp.]|jgi:hypothetical protein|uniref:right-handed parallel beta-helix repeat-containing protein n=1 Tax=Dyella sp. TaxID=1869338 RepID=UPI002D797183|nr:right-handed parallel beta-helix repeat-containing protein [Dyella sp.]HET6431614.1 right-handed parallel beta-helix repeat-containing protein [Dyella sp.]
MNKIQLGRASAQASPSSRRRARGALLTVLALALGSVVAPASAAVWWTTSPTVVIGSKIVDVRNAGARGDGVHDDTAAFQAAINSLPSTGGTVVVPAGRYMINPVASIKMRSHTRLKLDPSAQLVAIPTSSERYYVIKVWGVTDVEVTGGQVIGERAKHMGSTGEWGMGVDIRASDNVYLHDIKVSSCWGDGVYVGATGPAGSAIPSTDVTLRNVVSDGNRRQGLSITVVDRVFVYNSTFSNNVGILPQSGIDVEPMWQGPTRNVRIEKNHLIGNAGNGLVMHGDVSGVVVKSTTSEKNNGYGILAIDIANTWIAANLITQNGLDGVAMTKATHDVKITSNTINYNSTRWFITNNRSIFMLTKSPRDVQIDSTTRNITFTNNILSPTP